MNPLDNNRFTFELRFNNIGGFGVVPITEPVKFDGATYIVQQGADRFGRDISLLNDSIDLIFYKGEFDPTQDVHMLPNGTIITHLTQGFEYLIETDRIHGFESEVQFAIMSNGLELVAELNFSDAETDGKSFFSCKAIQDTSTQIIKRKEDTVVNVFSDEDIYGNPISPLQTTNILLKAKPITQLSTFKHSVSNSGIATHRIEPLGGGHIETQDQTGVMTAQTVVDYGIENTLSFLSTRVALTNGNPNVEGYTFIESINDLSNINIDITNVSGFAYEVVDILGSDFVETGNGYTRLVVKIGQSVDLITESYILWQHDFSYTSSQGFPDPSILLPETFNLNIPSISSGNRIYIYFEQYAEATFSDLTPSTPIQYQVITQLNNIDIKMTATSTAIDTVVKGVRYVDAAKKVIESINGLPVNSPKFDVGGKFYEQFIMSGNLIRGKDDLPFNLKFKDIIKSFREVAGGYQITNDFVYINQYEDFYPNKEIGSFPSFPDESIIISNNERFKVNQINYKYKNFEQDKDESNTRDSVHTDSQFSTPNTKVDDELSLDFDHIRDAYKIAFLQKEAIKVDTSLSDDEKIVLLDVVPLAPNTQKTFSRSLAHNVDSDGRLQLLNDSTFNWELLGFNTGALFTVNNTVNAGNYTVHEITGNIITLTGSPTSALDDTLTSFSYTLNNVLYTNRTDEGFDLIENLLNSTNFSNLKYTIKRNLKEWYNYIATICRNHPNGILKNTLFINNGELRTRLTGETEITEEKADVNISDLGDGILTTKEYQVKLVADWSDTVNMLNSMNTVNDDGTIGGFITVFQPNGKVIKGYPKKLEYEPVTETLTATLEERNEGLYLDITSSNGVLTVNEVGYDSIDLSTQWYRFDNDYLTIYKRYTPNELTGLENGTVLIKDVPYNKPIINPTRYNYVRVNGELSVSATELADKLIQLTEND